MFESSMDLLSHKQTLCVPQDPFKVPQSLSRNVLFTSKSHELFQSELHQYTQRINVAKKEEEIKFETSNQADSQKCFQCRTCGYLGFKQNILESHKCDLAKTIIKCHGCSNVFASNESYVSHLINDHHVPSDETIYFIEDEDRSKIDVVDYQTLRKHDNSGFNQPKSKIFIKDVTLLRKPDLPHNDISIPNMFDSLDLTTTDDDIFDDFLGDDPIFDDDFDFDENANLNNVDNFTPVEVTPEIEIISSCSSTPVPDNFVKISVKKNLCEDSSTAPDVNEEIEDISETPLIFVRSHESLTNQALASVANELEQPPESVTPDCVIISSEVLPKGPTSKIFIRNLETLTNPLAVDSTLGFSSCYTNDSQVESNSSESLISMQNSFQPAIFVRSYDSLVSDHQSDSTDTSIDSSQMFLENGQQRCKISIKNMNTLIEPMLMQPPLINPINSPSMVFGQAQNLVIHMRPQKHEENLLSYRDESVTPDTSDVSTCGGNDDVIILDHSGMSEIVLASLEQCENHMEVEDHTEVIQPVSGIATPERNDTPNEKTVLENLKNVCSFVPSQAETNDSDNIPMVRIPKDFSEVQQEPVKKKMKIVKIIRIKKKKTSQDQENNQSSGSSSTNVKLVFKCSQVDCNQHFSSAQLLKFHIKCHKTNDTITCPECDVEESYKNFNTLHTHLWRAHKIDMNLFACKLCDFKTPILARLKNVHEKIHSEEKNCRCRFSNCDKKFKNLKQLKNHEQIHKNQMKKMLLKEKTSNKSGTLKPAEDDKKFNCESCDYSTNDHNSFRRHKSQHSMVHQYKCPACDYSSIQSNTYRKHLLKQHPELADKFLHKCTQCNFMTISRAKYDSHMTKHREQSGEPKLFRKSMKQFAS